MLLKRLFTFLLTFNKIIAAVITHMSDSFETNNNKLNDTEDADPDYFYYDGSYYYTNGTSLDQNDLMEDGEHQDGKNNNKVKISSMFSDGDVAIYVISTGISKKNPEFKPPYFKSFERVAFFNSNPEYFPFKGEDIINKNDENGAGSAAIGTSCSKTYGSFQTPGIAHLTSVKVFDKFARGDPFAYVRAMRWISRDILEKNYKRSVVLFSPPTFIAETSNLGPHCHPINYRAKYSFQRRLVPLIERTFSRLTEYIEDNGSGDEEVLFVMSAGDFHFDLTQSIYAKHYERLSESSNVLIIGAYDQKTPDNNLLINSNRGHSIINGYAPGNEIETWGPIPSRYIYQRYRVRQRSNLVSGTTSAAAHVAGYAMNLFSDHPDLTSQEVKDIITKEYGMYTYE